MSAHGGLNLRVNKKYTRQESNLRLGPLSIHLKKQENLTFLAYGYSSKYEKIHPAGIEPATWFLCICKRKIKSPRIQRGGIKG